VSCFYLRPAWRVLDQGRPTKEITFTKKGSQLDPDYEIPCGKCDGCAADKARDWAIRMAHESYYHDRACFVTLTYEKSPGKINKKHVQDFIKRLRKESNRPIRYFVTGEYGEQTRRPHYHAIIYGEDFRGGSFAIDHQLYAHKRLDGIWKFGTCAISEFTLATALYVAGYTNKKLNDPDTFSLMSRRPPLGWRYAREHQDELCRRETVVLNGQEFPIPKCYFEWMDPSKFRPGMVYLDSVDRRKCLTPMSIDQQRKAEINHQAKRRLKEEKL